MLVDEQTYLSQFVLNLHPWCTGNH